MKWLGIDLGTTYLKAALFDERLQRLQVRRLPVNYQRSPGRATFSAAEFTRSLAELLHEFDTDDIGAIGLTGQAETMVVLDAAMQPISPFYSWMDSRAELEAEELKRHFGVSELIAQRGSLEVDASEPAPKVLHLQRHEPEVMSRAGRILVIKDYVTYLLTGEICTEKSIAYFTGYYASGREEFWAEMLDYIGLRPEQLPQIVEPGVSAGVTTPQAAEQFGIPAGIPVSVGALDHFAGMIGSGNLEPGTVTESTGTVMTMASFARTGRFADDMTQRSAQPHYLLDGKASGDVFLTCYYGPMPDTRVFMPVITSGGASLEWYRDAFLPGQSFADIDDVCLEKESSGLAFLPYLLGSNPPENDLRASGLLYGLRNDHDAYDVARSLMEGVAHVLRRNLTPLRTGCGAIERIISTGGGAKSALWCQLKANVTGLEFVVPQETEAALLGSAIMGAVAAGAYPDINAAYAVATEGHRRNSFLPQWSEERRVAEAEYFDALYKLMIAAGDQRRELIELQKRG